MKISKNYLQKIIKEEINRLVKVNHLNESSDSTKETKIKMSPMDFLNLTTHENDIPLKDIEKRYYFKVDSIKQKLEKSGINPERSQELAKQELADGLESTEIPFLVINKDGKVINHEGRLRSYYYNFIKQPKKNNIDVTIYHPANLDVTKPNIILRNQFDDEISITINKLHNTKQIDISELNSINNIDQARLSGIFREIVSNLTKNNNMSKQEAVDSLNQELKKYDVILNPVREEEFSIICTISPMISARVFKTNFNPESKLNNPESNLFQNPLSWKDKISLRRK